MTTTYSDGYNGRSPYGDLSCCGRPVANLAGLAEAADMLPASTRAGRRARARLALAVLERRAMARGDKGMVARARQGLASLGTVADDARRSAVAASIATVRAQRGDGSADRFLTQRRAVRNASQVTLVLQTLSGLVAIAQGVAAGEAAAERTRAAAEGRDVNFSAADTEKALSWVAWMLGGDFPVDVGEKDLRIFNSILNNPGVITAVEGSIEVGKGAANAAGQTELAGFLTWLKGYYRTMRTTTAAAVAALPVPVAPPAPPPPGGGFVVGPATGIRCPDGQVSTAYGCRPPCPAGTYQDRSGCVPFSRPIGPDGRPIDYVVCPDGSRASSAARCPGASTKSSGLVVALPAAALLWYFLK